MPRSRYPTTQTTNQEPQDTLTAVAGHLTDAVNSGDLIDAVKSVAQVHTVGGASSQLYAARR